MQRKKPAYVTLPVELFSLNRNGAEARQNHVNTQAECRSHMTEVLCE